MIRAGWEEGVAIIRKDKESLYSPHLLSLLLPLLLCAIFPLCSLLAPVRFSHLIILEVVVTPTILLQSPRHVRVEPAWQYYLIIMAILSKHHDLPSPPPPLLPPPIVKVPLVLVG